LQRAATARTADRKTGQNVRRHDLYRSNASMIEPKKNDAPSPIGGESNSGSARSCHWEAESSGRTTIIECFVFGVGIGTEIAVRLSEWGSVVPGGWMSGVSGRDSGRNTYIVIGEWGLVYPAGVKFSP